MSLPVNLDAVDSAKVMIKPNDLIIALKDLLKIFETFLASIFFSI